MDNYCDCGEKLIFEERISILDRYDDKILVCNKYYCPKCFDEYEINEEVDQVTLFVNIHMSACENWREGKITKVWHDANGVLCIKYESGNWWHYKLNNNNDLEWW